MEITFRGGQCAPRGIVLALRLHPATNCLNGLHTYLSSTNEPTCMEHVSKTRCYYCIDTSLCQTFPFSWNSVYLKLPVKVFPPEPLSSLGLERSEAPQCRSSATRGVSIRCDRARLAQGRTSKTANSTLRLFWLRLVSQRWQCHQCGSPGKHSLALLVLPAQFACGPPPRFQE